MADIKIALAVDAENPVIGDLYLENGTIRLTRTLTEEVAQELFIRLKFFKGEWFLDTTLGLPYFQSILVMGASTDAVAQIFRRVIAGTPGVKSIKSLQLTRLPNRALSVAFVAILDDGATLTSSDFAPFIVSPV